MSSTARRIAVIHRSLLAEDQILWEQWRDGIARWFARRVAEHGLGAAFADPERDPAKGN